MVNSVVDFLISNGNIVEIITILGANLLIISAFLIVFFKCKGKKNYYFYKRWWYLPFVCGIIMGEYGICIVVGINASVCFITLSLGLVFFSVICAIPVKADEKSDKINFIRFLDEKINASRGEKRLNSPPEKLSTIENPQERKPEIDFSHVKNVISRLNYFSLSTQDRNIVKELELSVLQAERGDYDAETKRKINDGLGALLKIMSKYGA